MRRRAFPIRWFLMMALIIFLIFGIFISILVSSQYSQRMWLRQKEKTLSSFSVAAGQITNLLMTARQTAMLAQSDEAVIEYLWGTFDTDAARISALRTMGTGLMETMKKNGALHGIFFAKADESLHGMTAEKLYLSSGPGHPFIHKLNEMESGRYNETSWIAPFQLQDLSQKKSTQISMRNTLVLGILRSHLLFSYNNTPQDLTTLAVVNINSLCECFNYLSTAEEPVILVNQDGECIASAGMTWRQGVIDCWQAVDTHQSQGSGIWSSSQNEKKYVVYYMIPSTHWYLVKMIPTALFEHDTIQLRLTTIMITLILLGLLAVIYLIGLNRLSKSLDLIIYAMEQMRKGNLSMRLQAPMSIWEFDVICKQFNNMAGSMEQLVLKTKAMEEDRVALEATSLRTQLSPHMIFNSIASIRWMAVILGQKTIASMLGELAELLRPVFREWRPTWSLREEINHLDHYVALLQLRCGGMLDLTLQVPEELMAREIPCFILQPILENSFEHGMKPSNRFHVVIRAELREEDTLYVVIQDDGNGIPPQKLAELRGYLRETENENYMPHGIGLSNVNRKIRLFFGNESGIMIESVLGKGTSVTLSLKPYVN